MQDKTPTYEQILEALFQEHAELTGAPRGKTWSYTGMFRSVPVVGRLLPGPDEKQAQVDRLIEAQKYATTYLRWYEISLQLDELLGNNKWKETAESECYDYELVRSVTQEMREAREARDSKLLLYIIRTKWTRNLGNMGDINLYRHSFVGTKKIVEEYIEECQNALTFLTQDPEANLDDRYLLGMLIQTRKNIGRTALVLSGGSTFGIFHIGVLASLMQANLLPRIVSGSSAGSIMASILCCNTNEEIGELLVGITQRKFNIFGEGGNAEGDEEDGEGEKPNPRKYSRKNNFKSLLDHLSHFLKYGTFFDSQGLKQTMLDFVGDLTFREAYNRTGKILNITVSPASMHDQTRLLNYLTAPNCLVWSAVCASCSLPGFFPSTSIYERTPSTGEVHEWNNDSSMKYVDGSVDNDLPITRLLEMFNVDHIIAVQVNPHVVPILRASVSNIGGDVETQISHRLKVLLNNVYDFMSSEIVHYLQMLNEMNTQKIFSNKLIAILSQNYLGDVTICAEFKPVDFLKLFENPLPAFLLDFIVRGVRAAWPKITVIKNHCEVEFALDKAITMLRGRVILSSVDKRRKLSPNNDKAKNARFLVNSPMSAASSPRAERRIKLHPPLIRRHNSSYDPKRNSIHTQNPVTRPVSTRRKITRGKSTTALAMMQDDDEPVDEHEEIHLEPPGRVRRARSSGNFYPHSLQIVLSSPRKSLDTKDLGSKIRLHYPDSPYVETNGQTQSAKKDPQANLPCVTSKARTNSYMALNRLKESNLKRNSATDPGPVLMPYGVYTSDNDDNLMNYTTEESAKDEMCENEESDGVFEDEESDEKEDEEEDEEEEDEEDANEYEKQDEKQEGVFENGTRDEIEGSRSNGNHKEIGAHIQNGEQTGDEIVEDGQNGHGEGAHAVGDYFEKVDDDDELDVDDADLVPRAYNKENSEG